MDISKIIEIMRRRTSTQVPGNFLLLSRNPEKLDNAENLLICSNISNMNNNSELKQILNEISYNANPITIDNTITIDIPPNPRSIVDINGEFGTREVENILGDRLYERIIFAYCPKSIYYFDNSLMLNRGVRELWRVTDKHLAKGGIVATFDSSEEIIEYLGYNYGIEVYDELHIRENLIVYLFRK